MYCEKCGHEIAKSAKFCPECGASIVTEKKSKKQKVKKPIYKRWWFWAIIVIVILGSGGSDDNAVEDGSLTLETAVVQQVEETAVPVETTVPIETITETTVATETTAASEVSIETALTFVEATMKGTFDNYNISHENNIITINVWDDGIAVGAMLAAAGDEECLESWEGLVDNQAYFCNSIWELVKTLGLDDTAVVVNVLNDGNKENVLLSTMNGVVFYNCVTE